MIKVIGQINCSRCDIVKRILDNKGISYDYFLLENLDENTKKQYISLARKSKKLEMPLIIKEEKIVDIKEVI